ncbi:MAG: 50S ribosomal protein L24 [Thermoproteota archaeon]|nr:50S ribosomal protein L24 [Candidatus Brockarchaeota archaeon]MBO3768147.1 50S ribosomal protein L24 [Candidatus Brockarchaeota archaeon]MBO3801054.1 50S ribosomal protein L24 [Candidatus Brockarchaeota archaeon]
MLYSKKPSKQRKMLYNLPLHKRKLLVRAHVADSIKEKYKIKAITLRKNDEVVIIKGDYKGVKGLVTKVDRKKGKIYIEGVTREKADGTVLPIPISPSNVVVTKLDLSDKKRIGVSQ